MSFSIKSPRKNKVRRAVFASVSFLTVLAAGGIVFGVIEHVRESVDRAH